MVRAESAGVGSWQPGEKAAGRHRSGRGRRVNGGNQDASPGNAANVPTVRAALSEFVDQNWPEAVRDGPDIALAVTEACSNAVRHAYPAGAGDMTITSRVGDHHLTIRVTDRGGGMTSPSLDPGMGVGLKLIHALAEATVTSTHRGTTINLRFAL